MADFPTNLPQIQQSQSQKEVTANAEDDAASPSTLYGRNAAACAALTWGFLGGWVPVAGVPTLIANGTLALTASATCYIRKLDSTGAVSFVTSAPTAWPALNGGYTPLYEVVVGTTGPTSWKDYRSSTLFGAASGAGASPTGAAGGDLTGTYPNPTIGTNKVTLAQMAQLATARLLGRTTAGTGNVEALTVLPTALVPAFTGDVTTAGAALATTIATNAVTNAKAAQMAAHTFKMNNTGSTANAVDATVTQVQVELNPIPLNSQSGTTYTLLLADAGQCVEMSNASANTLTVPPNSSVAFPIGTNLLVRQMGAGLTTIAQGAGVTIRTPLTLVLKGQYATASLHKRATDEWCLDGNIT